MKIYHTETQADYDALMVELEAEGCVWMSFRKPTESKDWIDNKENTCVKILDKKITRAPISVFKVEYPHITITKFKAKVNDIKPTNGTSYQSKDRPKFKIWDNEKNEWYKPTYEAYNGTVEELVLSPKGDLKMRTLSENAHESTFPDRFEVVAEPPEKIVVPKFVAEWIELCKEKANLTDCLQGGYRHFSGCERIGEDEDWLFEGNNQDVVARAWLDGYEVEKDPLYQVQVNNLFFFSWGESGVQPTFNQPFARKQAKTWSEKKEAEEVSEIIGGKVVEMDE